MPSANIPTALRQLVIERANNICEYCLLHQDDTDFTHHIDHIIPRKHSGKTVIENLALACLKCNKYKGSDIAAIDPIDNEITPLFHPRQQIWSEHFELFGAFIIGKTNIGRATAAGLRLNDPARVNQRQELIALGRYLQTGD